MRKITILVLDDDPVMVKLITASLVTEGYHPLVAKDGEDALEKLEHERVDLVLLDIMMPGMDGEEVCRCIRECSAVPIIMVTAKARMADKVRLLDYGADDYLTKPFGVEELLARVRAVIRRGHSPVANTAKTFRSENLEIDFVNQRVRANGHEVELTTIEFDLLKHMALNADKVLTHRDLLTKVWGGEVWDTTEYLRTYISRLRNKLEEDPRRPLHIVTKTGVGYCFRTETTFPD